MKPEIPPFLRSEGPYTLYNHHKMMGEIYHENAKLTKSEAKRRVYDQLEKIKEEKEHLKKQFKDQIQSEEETYKIQQQLKKLQNLENQQYIKMQMENRDKMKKAE
jgi:hypothetical protein